MASRLLIIIAAGAALAACSVEHNRVQQPAVAVAPSSTIVYTDPAPTTTVYTAAAPVTTVYTTR
jgi:hypothetical protein